MPVVSLDALALRRELIDAKTRLEDFARRQKRTERAMDALRDVLSALPDPVEVIGEDLHIQFANRASRERYREDPEGTPYFRTLLGKDAPPEACPVITALRENREIRLTSTRDGQSIEVVVAPTVLSGGQKAVVRTSRAVGELIARDTNTPEGSRPAAAKRAEIEAVALGVVRDMESMREIAAITSQTLNTGRLFTRLLPVLSDRLDAPVVLYYQHDVGARRFALQGAITPDIPSTPPEHLAGEDHVSLLTVLDIDAAYLNFASVSEQSALPENVLAYLTRAGVTGAVVVPARSPASRHGALIVARTGGLAISGEHDRLLSAVSQLLGSAIERNNLVRSLKRNVTTVMDLQRAGMAVTTSDDIESVFTRLAHAAIHVLNFAAMKVRVMGVHGHPDGFASSYPGPFTVDGALLDETTRASGSAIESGEMEIVAADGSLRMMVDESADSRLTRCRSVTVVPMYVGERIHGVVQLFAGHAREEIVAMKPVLRTLVDHAAAALLHCDRLGEMRERLDTEAPAQPDDDEGTSTGDLMSRMHELNNYLSPALYHAEQIGTGEVPVESIRRSAATIQSYLTLCGETLRTVLELLDPGSARNFQSEPATGPTPAPEPDVDSTWSSVAGSSPEEDERPRTGRILVAVGHSATRQDLLGLLSGAGHEVTPTADAAEVVAALGAQPFDCIVCGLGLPGMDDGAFVSMLSEQYPGVRDRIVLVATEDASAGSNWHAAGAGIPCIEPPLTIEKVIGAVRNALMRETADGTHG